MLESWNIIVCIIRLSNRLLCTLKLFVLINVVFEALVLKKSSVDSCIQDEKRKQDLLDFPLVSLWLMSF